MDNFKRLYRIVFKITISIVLPVSGGIIMLSPQIIVLFFGQEYLPATGVLRFLFIAFIFACMNGSLYYILISTGKQRLILVGSAITFLINITLCLLLFPSYGYKSSEVIVAISTMLLFCFNYVFVSKAIGTINILSLSYKQIFSTFIMMAMLFLVPIENIFLLILLGG
ncbi:MAG: polysaccharide biosynthesis C-terminal domain-containing protein [Candidatus Desantisbacteria bacterium]